MSGCSKNIRKSCIAALSLLWLLMLTACDAASDKPAESGDSEPIYRSGFATQGGTGRYYMNREIAHVMSFQGAGWLERSERQEEERTDLTLDRLPLDSASVVADIGAGSGYFSRLIAERVPDGQVFAVDIQPEMLAILEQNIADEKIQNVQPILAAEKSLNLAPASLDLALFVDVYHELAWPREIMLDLYTALKPGGKVVLVEYRAEDPTIQIIPVHKMTAGQAIREMRAIGLEFVENGEFLPRQHFLVFRKPAQVTQAWDCPKTGYVVSSTANNRPGLWLFLPGSTLELARSADEPNPDRSARYQNETINLTVTGTEAVLAQDGAKENCKLNRKMSIREDAKLRGIDFLATGNEPPWKLEISTKLIAIQTGYESARSEFPAANPRESGEETRTIYSTSNGSQSLEIEISGTPCLDSMSGEPFSATVVINLDGKRLRGCGAALH